MTRLARETVAYQQALESARAVRESTDHELRELVTEDLGRAWGALLDAYYGEERA